MQRVLNHTIALTFNTVTGASTGFGRELAKIVLENGDTAVATARRPEVLADLVAKYPADRLLTLKLDVTKQQDVLDAFSAAQAKFGRVDVVANNAAFITLGEIESVPDADARAMFETNFWGAAWVSREAVRFFREVNPAGAGGRLLQISSACGFQGVPGTAYYSATKFGESSQACSSRESRQGGLKWLPWCFAALEGFSETLASELDPAWNIKVSDASPLPSTLTWSSTDAGEALGHHCRTGTVRHERSQG